jgi:hypothetical protein
MKKIVILLMALALLPLANIAAQSRFGYNVFSFDIGYAPTYNLDSGAATNGNLFSLNVLVGDAFAVSFTNVGVGVGPDGNTASGTNLFSLKYPLLEKIRPVVSIGSTTDGTNSAAVAGLGVEFAPFTRRFGDALATDLKLLVEYVFVAETSAALTINSAGPQYGTFIFGISFGVGI